MWNWNPETKKIDFQISDTGIDEFERGSSYSWSVTVGGEGIGSATEIDTTGDYYEFYGTLKSIDNVFQYGELVRLVGTSKANQARITYDLGVLQKDAQPNSSQTLVVGRSVASLADFMDDGAEPYSSSADIIGDGMVGAVDYVIFSGA